MIRRSGMSQRYNRLGELFGQVNAWAAEDAEDEALTADEQSAYAAALQDAAAGLEAARAVMAKALDRLANEPDYSAC